MRNFCVRILVLVGIVIFLDFVVGSFCEYLYANAKGGVTKASNFICNEAVADCMVFGSSRASHHYDPQILEDSLNLSSYNCGKDGNGIISMYARYLMVCERNVPELLIYEVTPDMDLLLNDNHKYLTILRPYYNRHGVNEIILDVDASERYKMLSKCYRYNSQLPTLLVDYIHPEVEYNRGYLPIDKVMSYEKKTSSENRSFVYDSLKIKYLNKLVARCRDNNTRLVFYVSPSYGAVSDEVFNPIKEIAKENDIVFMSHYADEKFSNKRDYFYDSTHMNRTGATEYSRQVASEILQIIEEH